ncbi:STAS-like domain-containing protein [Aquibium sp. ELW1220]|uniref:STAS-like domain-containing protein n=1 Tax=Aquibium sp. ELW1220 TaxID=2976766 RepID=UPI0025AFEE0C|nr:STAS-like domain-containing protein [Aquibium sp. ELW1220]MDN2584355.1 STAS-like domain-containing protein [Aquibium sp. ELW1220]
MMFGEDMKKIRVSIVQIVGGGICVSAIDGQKVYEVIYSIVKGGDRVELSFSSVTRMTTAFLNAAVGQLYGEFPEELVKNRLAAPVDFEPWHLQRLKLVTDRAKLYFADHERVKGVFNGMTGQVDDDDI